MPWPKGVMEKPNWLSLQKLGLGLKLHLVNCDKHPDEKGIEFFEGDISVNFEVESSQTICELLANSLYMRYSAILILINCYCRCRNKILKDIIKSIEKNKYLNYKLQLIYTFYDLLTDRTDLSNIWQEYFAQHVDNLLNVYNRNLELAQGQPKEEELYVNLDDLVDNYEMESRNITMDDKEPLRDYLNFTLKPLENIVLYQKFIWDKNGFARAEYMGIILYVLDCLPLLSAQELSEFEKDPDYPLAIQTKAKADLYFYGINPALAIVNNNYIFTNQKPGLGIREGSQKDVRKIIRELKISRTPYILTEDFSRSQLLNFVKFLSKTNLKALKSLLFITMTHGTSNNIIYTHDGELNFIEDILIPIQENESLKGSSISFINVHCRGLLNAQHSDPLEFDQIPATQIPQLKPNTSVFFSVPNLTLSPRDPQIGAPFVGSLCQMLRDLTPLSDIKELRDKIHHNLRTDSYYAYLDCFGHSSELLLGDAAISHCILPAATGAGELITQFEAIEDGFRDSNHMKQRNKQSLRSWLDLYMESLENGENPTMSSEVASTTFCISAQVNEKKFAKNIEELKYFSEDLDEDISCVGKS